MQPHYDPRNATLRYWVNGVLRHRDEPGLSPFDSVVHGGDAVWEGVRVSSGRIFALDAHLARLRRSAKALAFLGVPDDEEIVAAISDTLQANGMTDGVEVRVTLTRGVKVSSGLDPRLNTAGCTLIVLAEHSLPVDDTEGIRLVTASLRRPGPDVLDPKIHHNNLLNSILAKIEANAAGADDAMMLDGRGFVAESSTSHLFAMIGGALITPRPVACPEGITRATVLELAAIEGLRIEVRDVSPGEMHAAAELFCTGTTGEIVGVIELDGRPIGDGAVGPITRRVAKLYQAHAGSHGTVVA